MDLSKKVVWIWSTDANRGLKSLSNAVSLIDSPIRFQRELRETLAPEWEVEFIHDNSADEEKPIGDITVWPQSLNAYIEKNKYPSFLVIPELDIMQKDYSAIKERLAEFL